MIRALVDVAFEGRFDDHDWEHAFGGIHVISEADGSVVAHASVVPRTLAAGDRLLAAGYVEAVATDPAHRNEGRASAAMREIAAVIAATCEVGALSTASPTFYERLGWERWQGETYVQGPEGRVRTADDDAGVMVLRTAATADVSLHAPLTCDWRAGDVW
ncbi:MAG: GNAT family N-acetyltransferase [Actinobacteria bacterium]|nr:GNAT family N-acetyltransferase [Actinomycetota bacterium]